MKNQSSGMRRAEGIEQIFELDGRHDLPCGLSGNRPQSLVRMNRSIGHSRPELELVRHQRMHPVDGNKLFGQSIGCAELFRFGTGDTGKNVSLTKTSKCFRDVLSEDAPPASPHRELD